MDRIAINNRIIARQYDEKPKKTKSLLSLHLLVEDACNNEEAMLPLL